MAISLEVAEHLPETRANTFIEDIVSLSDIVLFLGPDNIMTTNAIPEEKKFLNEMFDITYKDASFLNKANIKKFEQSSKTFEQLDSYLKNVIGEKENDQYFRNGTSGSCDDVSWYVL